MIALTVFCFLFNREVPYRIVQLAALGSFWYVGYERVRDD